MENNNNSFSLNTADDVKPGYSYAEIDIQELIELRQDAYRVKVRTELASKLKTIEEFPMEPYRLPEWMGGVRELVLIWELVFDLIYDLETIVSLREVCDLFRDLLEMKYVAATLPEVVGICSKLEKNGWNRYRWFDQQVKLEVLSRASKATVDSILESRTSGETIFTVRDPDVINHYSPDLMSPLYRLRISEVGQPLLERCVGYRYRASTEDEAGLLPPKSLIIDESLPLSRERGAPTVDLVAIRESFQTIVEKVGGKCMSLEYRAKESCGDVIYRALRQMLMVAPMDHLKELIVAYEGTRTVPRVPPTTPPFPSCQGLKRYMETKFSPGLSAPCLLEIFTTNPQIEEVMINDSVSSDLEVFGIIQALDILDIKKLFCICTPSVEFFQHRFHWASKLTAFTLWDNGREDHHEPRMNAVPEIPSDVFFAFLSSLKNLRILRVSSKYIRNTGGYLELPKLTHVMFEIEPRNQSLEFLKPCEALEQLDLDMRKCKEFRQGHGTIYNFLAQIKIPSLFPALKVVNVWFYNGFKNDAVWKKK